MKFVKEHIFAIFAMIVLLIILAASAVAIYLLFYSEDVDPYHTRLNEIDKYPIESKIINDTKEKLIESGKVDKVEYKLEGRLINFDIYFVRDIEINAAKEIATKVLEGFSKEQLSYYDVHIILINKAEEAEIAEKNKELEESSKDNTDPNKEINYFKSKFPVFGTKHKTSETIRWTK